MYRDAPIDAPRMPADAQADTATTEDRNPRTTNIDRASVLQALAMINAEDRLAVDAVSAVLEDVARAIESMIPLFQAGGAIHYFGAGTSGRLAVLDAAEVPPTYGVPADRFIAHIAGGESAMTSAVEDAEDSAVTAESEVRDQVRDGDIVVALAASGRTPYAMGAVRAARDRGILTIAIVATPGAPLQQLADITIVLATGAEAITGSTRMKAATAQKIVLHSISTVLMVRTGYTYSNLMIGVVPTNAKLRRRVILMLEQATGCAEDEARTALAQNGGDPRKALARLLDMRREPGVGAPGHLGIDAGGTGARLAFVPLQDDGADPIRSERSGNSTAEPVAADGAAALIGLVEDLLTQHPRIRIRGIGIGIAGAEAHPEAAQSIADAVGRRFGVDVDVVGDGVAQYFAAHADQRGAVLAVGTGAVAYGFDGDRLRRSDGLGFHAGDFGSGARVGAEAARSAMRSLRGLSPRDALLERCFLTHFGSAEAYADTLNRSAQSATVFAGFAAPFLALTEQGHPLALRVCAEAAADLIRTLDEVVDAPDTPVVLVGGVLHTSSPVGVALRRALRERGTPVSTAERSAEWAAAEMLLRHRESHLPPAFSQRIRGSAHTETEIDTP